MANTPQDINDNPPSAPGVNQNTRVATAQATLVTAQAERQSVGASIEAIRVLNELDNAADLATAVDALATVLDTTVR